VYVSCNPETLARDLKLFMKQGYRVKRLSPVDMFPLTDNLECCALLEKGR
ncbi:MAG: 23S rRNA (uracil(1939)-C(5))-methyltransferase RlmD, partial [Lachnospiraceae bacterium]|nr:23S rRNA (uracil(1939)-C(5))-methyltransferase RlmD [Lachnospiraceae bacterium]